MQPIRVAPSGRYFETFDNQPFLFIGANDAISWPGLNGLFRRRDLASVEAYLQNMSDNGVTILRLMLEYHHRAHRAFERPAGRFVPAMVRLWDDLFALCERFGLRVLLAPWDNFWMARRWNHHSYNVANGGPAPSPAAFFTDEATIAATERRLCFVAERWGGSPAFGAWDLFNEIDAYWGGSPEQQGAVLSRLSQAIREVETRKWGFTRPQTVSFFGPEPPGGYQEMIFRHPDLDFATTHIYHKEAIDYPRNTIAPALSMARWTRFGREHALPTRPYLDSEHGPIALFNNHHRYLPEAFDDEYERHLMWAHLASGGAGSGLRWPARHPHITTPGMRRSLKSLAEFSRLIDWRHFAPDNAQERVRVSARDKPFKAHIVAVADTHQAVLWLLRDQKNDAGLVIATPPLCDLQLKLQGLTPGTYLVHAWSTGAGTPASPATCTEVDNSGALHAALPPLSADLAVAIHPVRGVT